MEITIKFGKPDMEKIKEHIKRNKWKYIAGSLIGVAVITWSIVRRKDSSGIQVVPSLDIQLEDSDYSQGLKNGLALQTVPGTSVAGPVSQTHGNASPISFAGGDITQKITTNVYKDRKGHPGYLTRCIDTNEIFESQKRASVAFGISDKVMSEHLNGKLPDANGHHFERVELS